MKWYTETDLRDFEPLWLLELTLGGRVYRFATETVTLDSDDGPLLFNGTLSGVEFTSEMDFVSTDFELPAASVEVVFREDIAKRIAQGVDLGAATAQLSLYRKGSGDDYDDRQVLVSGRVALPAYGAQGEPVGLEIEADWLHQSAILPPANHVVDIMAGWILPDANAKGAIYPLLFGNPGAQGFSGSPVYVVHHTIGFGAKTYGLVCGHATTCSAVTIVRVLGTDGTSSTSVIPLEQRRTNDGVLYSRVDLTGNYTAGDSFFARFDVASGGAQPSPFARFTRNQTSFQNTIEGFLQGAGDILRFMLQASGVKVDEGRTAAAAQLLNGYELDFFIGERVDVMDFITSEILPLLPCSLRTSSEGIYPVVWRYDATVNDAKTKLVADKHIYRDGAVQYQSTPVYNEITLRYRYNARYAKLMAQVTVTGDTNKDTGDFLWRSSYSITSQSRYGPRPLDLQTELVASRASAGRIINWMSRAYSGKHKRITYRAPYKLGYLQVGDIVAITDSELYFDEQVMLIQAIEWTEEDLVFTFLMIPDLPRDTIPVG